MATIRCPHCECQIPLTPKMAAGQIYTWAGMRVRGEIDEEGAVVKQTVDRNLTGYYQLDGSNYRIVGCIECSKEFVVQKWPPVVVSPLPRISAPSEMPDDIRRVFLEAKMAHAAGAETAAILAARTALIRMQREQESNIDKLAEDRKITRLLAHQANELRLWANVAGHDELPAEIPSPEDVGQLLQYLGELFDTLYVQPARLLELQRKRGGQPKT